MAWTPSSVAYGIRHNRLFGFLGRAGQAIDAVIALQGTGNVPFKCFTRIGWPDQITAVITDDDDHYRLKLDVDGIVLVINLGAVLMTPVNARDMFIEVVGSALQLTNPGRMINRVGVVETYDFPHGAPGEIAANSLTRLVDMGHPVDFRLRAAFRRPPPPHEGDWWNTILQAAAVKADEDGDSPGGPNTLRVSIDGQQHFVPERMFTPRLVRDHYVAFCDEAELMQTNQLAGLEVREPELR